jgi:hypothetical protein
MSALPRRPWLLLCAASLLSGLPTGLAHAQGQEEVSTVRVYCVKVAPGKAADYEAFLRDVTVPLNQSRADAGEFEWFGAERAVVPAGSSAPCDYALAYRYKGAMPEEASSDQLGAALKRAGLGLTAAQLVEKRNALLQLVAVEYWYIIDGVGPAWAKGSYVHVNYHNVRSGRQDEYVRLERTWKTLAEAWLKDGGKGSWGLVGLGMPSGDSQPYNAATLDVFPDWEGLVKGGPSLLALWPRVHPGLKFEDVEAQKDKVRSIPSRALYKLVESVQGKAVR